MQLALINQWIRALMREVLRHKWLVAGCFAVVSLLVLVIGIVWPKKYVSTGLIYADRQNIIAPLLKGSAEVTEIKVEESKQVREVIFSPRIMEQVAKDVGLLKGGETSRQVEDTLNGLRSRMDVTDVGRSYIGISFSAATADNAFKVNNAIIDNFIKDSAQTKRRESKEAYLFIDRQVASYKQQLQEAELKLKQFKADNLDGTEESVASRIAELRGQVESMTLDLQEANTRSGEISGQLKREDRVVNRNYKADVYRERLNQAQSQLETLRLSYEDTYPDIVVLKQQIEDLKKAIAETENATDKAAASSDGPSMNPLYQQLRSQQAQVEVDVRSRENRLASTKRLLDSEYERAKRIAERQAELSELSRDYNVTRGIYEDMLERKEKARLSMTLDLEGQGVTYKIQDPPSFPVTPSGLRFLHFALAGVLLGTVASIGLVVAYIMLDPRIRFTASITEELPIPVLGTVPHISTPVVQRLLRKDMVQVGFFLVAVLATYASIIVVRLVAL